MGQNPNSLPSSENKALTQERAPTTIDVRLLEQPGWPATAALIQQARDAGHDVAAAIPALVAHDPLDDRPATDLAYPLVSRLNLIPRTAVSPVPGGKYSVQAQGDAPTIAARTTRPPRR